MHGTMLLFLVTGRMSQSDKLPVLYLLTDQKSGFSPAGVTRLTDSGQIWHGRRAPGSAWRCDIVPQSAQGVGTECGPKISKFPLSGRVAPQGRTPWPNSNFFGDFYTTNYPTLVFKLDVIRFTGYGVIAENPRMGQLGRIFSVHPVWKTMRWIKKRIAPFWWTRRALSPCKVWGRSYDARGLYVRNVFLLAGCREAANCRYYIYSQAKN